MDRADILFEIRDATDYKPGPRDEAWWDGLAENQGESEWAGRARRRRGKTVFRLALIASKTRVGPDLDPRALELRLPAEGEWTVADVNSEIAGAHEKTKTEAADKKQAREDKAMAALKAALPVAKREAEALLKQYGLREKSARFVISNRNGTDWRLTGGGTKADPFVLVALAGTNGICA